jgi:menaquinone-dependent protoporphyrinogen oxidase
MRTLIVFATKYGTAEKCAHLLKDRLPGEVDFLNLKQTKGADLSPYGTVIIGGSIYMGGIQKEVKAFCTTHSKTLLDKKLGLYICCMRDGEMAETEIDQAFPGELLDHASVKDYFGGEFIFKKMSFMDRFIARKVAKIDRDTSTLSQEKLQRFAMELNSAS